MTIQRLCELHTYAEALQLKAEFSGIGNQRDLKDIVRALEELIALKAFPKADPASAAKRAA